MDASLSTPITQEDLSAIREQYGEVARHLSGLCNIPNEHFDDLCDVLSDADDVYLEEARHQAYKSYLIKNRREDAQELVYHAAGLLAAWQRLDSLQQHTGSRHFYEAIGGLAVELALTVAQQPDVSLPSVLPAIASACKKVVDISTPRRGGEGKNAPPQGVRPPTCGILDGPPGARLH
jgi:hypothetical protein